MMGQEENRMRNRRRAGAEKEEMAAKYLVQAGVVIRERNYRNRTGEVDIIGKDGTYLVFFEVKWRAKNTSGFASEAVDLKKQRQICRVADHYLYTHGFSGGQAVRFDVIALDAEKISWIKDAFPYCGKSF